MPGTTRALLSALLAISLIAPALAFLAPTVATAQEQASTPDGPAVPLFVEEAATGVDHAYDGSWQFFTGGGVAVLDCDDDELPDLYLAGGSEAAGLYRNTSTLGGPLAFEQLHSDVTDLTGVTGAYPLDIDSDGHDDLAVLRRGENVLLRGLGGCAFVRANEAWTFEGEDDWSTAFSATWQKGEAFPTLAVGDYLTIVGAGESPECDDNTIHRPTLFGYRTPEAIPGHCTLSMLFSDWDRSGRPDLRVSNDRQYYRPGEGEEQLWQVGEEAPSRAYTRDDGWEHLSVFGMGIASQDVTDDGYPDYFISTMAGNRLRTLADGPERPTFADGAYARGIDVPQPFAGDIDLPSTAWHAEWDDVNNDGLVDLYVAKGNVEQMPDHASEDPSNLLIGQPDGTWDESAIEAGIVHFDKTRGAALADLNLDGLLDLVEVNRAAPVRIWRNAGAGTATEPAPMGRWLAVELAQDGPNRDAIGAWIEVRRDDGIQQREVTVGGGHVSGQLGPTHFGLGEAEGAEVRVTWPDGEVGAWMPVAADQRIRIERGREQALALTSATELTGALPLVREGAEGPVLPPVPAVDPATCVPSVDPEVSVARLWDEALLDAVRRDFPAPTVHARNLYHASAAMWDAWAAYEPDADGVFYTGKASAADVAAARDEAVSYAAYRLLGHRYRDAAGGAASLRRFDELMAELCYPWALEATDGDSPASLGNRVAATIIEATMDDGSREAQGYTSRDYVRAQRAHDRAAAGHAHGRPRPLAAAGAGGQLHPERAAAAGRTAGVHRAPLGRGHRLRPARAAAPGPAHRPGPATLPARPRHGRRVQGQGPRGRGLQQHPRPARRGHRRHRPGHLGQRPPRQQRAGRPRLQPLDQPALRAGARAARRLRPGAGRVLGRRARLRDAAGPLEHARQRGRGPSRLRAPHRRRGTAARRRSSGT